MRNKSSPTYIEFGLMLILLPFVIIITVVEMLYCSIFYKK